MAKFGIGDSVRRLEDPRLLTGGGRYTDDIKLSTPAARAYVLRSPHAHADIKQHRHRRPRRRRPAYWRSSPAPTSRRKASATCPAWCRWTTATARRAPTPARPMLAKSRVRHVGDPVALVVAETLEQAQGRRRADRGRLRAAAARSTPGQRRSRGAPLVRDNIPGNLCLRLGDGRPGRDDAAFAKADQRVKLRARQQPAGRNSMEPRGAICELRSRQRPFDPVAVLARACT